MWANTVIARTVLYLRFTIHDLLVPDLTVGVCGVLNS
jgi:hypothetical protein